MRKDKLYGPETVKAVNHFSYEFETTSKEIVYELVNIKKQAAICNFETGFLSDEKKDMIVSACDEILNGKYDEQFVTPMIQGGAGTSTNMNVNEVISSISMMNMKAEKGCAIPIHPINDVNKHQSTNDVYPTAVKIALIKEIRKCAEQYSELQKSCQIKEQEYDNVLKLGRTQLMDAVPMRVGQMFSAFACAFERDRWRIYKTEERLRTINIGGTAIGTGINAPLKYMFLMTDKLQESTNIGLSRAENLIDNTQNLDCFVEVSSLLKTASTSLVKIANDLRILSSGPNGGIGEIILPDIQNGSTIMPGKVNPVILEHVIMVAQKIISNDFLVSQLVSMGNFEINQFLPLISETLLDSVKRLTHIVFSFRENCIDDILVDVQKCESNLIRSKALITPLIGIIGYDKASDIVRKSNKENKTIKEILVSEGLFTKEELEDILNPINITKPGIIEVKR